MILCSTSADYCHPMLHPVLEHAVDGLLTAWRHYDDVVRRKAAHRIRVAARTALDVERLAVHRLRRGLHPESRELEEVALSTTCPSLDAPVFVYHTDLDPAGGFLCPCGAVVSSPALPNEVR